MRENPSVPYRRPSVPSRFQATMTGNLNYLTDGKNWALKCVVGIAFLPCSSLVCPVLPYQIPTMPCLPCPVSSQLCRMPSALPCPCPLRSLPYLSALLWHVLPCPASSQLSRVPSALPGPCPFRYLPYVSALLCPVLPCLIAAVPSALMGLFLTKVPFCAGCPVLP